MAANRFAIVSEDEIENLKENAVSKSTKEAAKFGVKLFKAIKSTFPCYLIKCESIHNCSNDRGYSFERNCVLRRRESETLK